MRRTVKTALLLALSLVIVAGVVLAGCSKGQAKLQMPTIELSQYLKGTTSDLNDATLNVMAEGGGEAGFKFGTMKAIYPTLFDANKDAVAAAVFGSPYKFGNGVSATTYAQLTAGDQMTVDGTIFAAVLTAAEQNAVSTAVIGFLDRVDNDMAAAKAPDDTSAYALLKQNAGQAAADNWATDVAAGEDAADAFFTWLVKGFVLAYPTLFGLPSGYVASDTECAAIGKASFTNGTAGSMYPTQQEQEAQSMYGKAYKDLLITESPSVDAAVYADLPSAFGTGAAADAARSAIRDAMTANLQAYYGLSSDNYTALKGVEKAMVDQAIYSQLDAKDKYGNYTTPLGFGPHLERDYIDFAAVPGAVLSWGAELAPVLPLDNNMAYLTLQSSVDTTSANSWKKDVEAGVDPHQAFYRWLAKEGVEAMAAAGPLIQQSVQEFDFKVTNPNDYDISLDSLDINCQVTASTGDNVDAAKQALTDSIWVPAKEGDNEGEIILQVLVPAKTYNMITWLVSSGKTSDQAGALAEDVWEQIQAGTATWYVTVDAMVSNKTESQTQTYTLQWPLS